MDINSVSESYAAYSYKKSDVSVSDGKNTVKASKEEAAAVVYEKSSVSATDNKKALYQTDNAKLIQQMKDDLAQRKSQLRDMVASMLGKQSKTFALTDEEMYKRLRLGQFEADPETIEQAKKDVAEDGYWGVEQTSERILSFAKALAGNDPSKGLELLDAFKKGFEEATKTWGDTLPDISQKTYEATLKKFDAWMNGES